MPETSEKEKYDLSLQNLQNFLDFAIDVSESTADQKNIPWRFARAHQLYNRLTVTCMSIVRLLPGNKIFPASVDFWDFFSIAPLTRNFIENYFAFFYIGVDNVDPVEQELRLLIFNYHHNHEKYQIYKLFDAPVGVLEEFEINLPKDAEKIKNNRHFSTLKPFLQKEILTGKKFLYLSRTEIASRFAFSANEIKALYKFFSNHTHSSPFSFYSMSNERGRGLQNDAELQYTTMAIEVVIKYLSAAILDMTKIFPESVSALDRTKLNVIQNSFQSTG